MLEIISAVIYRKKYTMKRKKNFILVTDGLIKFLIHKILFGNVAGERNIHKILVVLTNNKELIIYRT